MEQLLESCVEAYTGIVQGMRNSNSELQLVAQHLPAMLQLVNTIASRTSPESLIGVAAGLVGKS